MSWYEFWGAYDNTGPYANVVLGGSPNTSGPYGINLTDAHNAGYGRGIEFTDNGSYGVTFRLNLVGYAVTDDGRFAGNSHYVNFGGNYRYKLTVHTSNNNQASWNLIYSNFVFSHPSNLNLCYSSNWTTVAQRSQWTQFFQLPTDTTHVRIELMGEDVTLPHHNIFSIQQIIPDFKPWAIRKAGKFKTLNRPSGKFQIRKSGAWQDKSVQSAGDTGQANKGKNRIRRSGQWVGQGQVGEN